jgi:hypothetical protein
LSPLKWKGCRAAPRGSRERRAYYSWTNLKTRCDNERVGDYRHYGGRGITYDPRWKKFAHFVADMGVPPEGTCLDRIDSNGDYCKDNCRWATPKEQNRNKRSNRIIAFDGERKTVTAWAEELGISLSALRNRLDSGWPLERALTAGTYNTRGELCRTMTRPRPSMAKLYNLARVTTATTGTGTVTLGAAVAGYLTFADAGVQNGDVVAYAIKDGSNSEIGRGAYSSAGPTLARDVIYRSSNAGAAISLSGAAEVFITPAAEDLRDLDALRHSQFGGI